MKPAEHSINRDWSAEGKIDMHEIRTKVWMALERARREVRPTVLEIDTYRYYGASIADANHRKYRTHEEIEERKARDPLMLWRRHLIEHGVTSDSGVELILAEVMVEIAKALEFAESGALPGLADIAGNVYWETDHATHASGIGSHFFNDCKIP